MFCSTPGRGFKADGMIVWWDTTFSYPLLPDQLRADSSLSGPEVQKAGSWTGIHSVLRRHNRVQPHRATGCALECSQGMAKPALQGHQVFGTQQWSVCQWLLTLLPELLSLFLSNHLALKAIFYSSVILLSEVKSISRAVGVSLL